jgi:signal transduction histidine kinase
MEFVFSPTDVLKLVRVTVDQLEPLAGIKALKLNFTPPQVVPPLVMADGEKVRQVVNNFIDNAIKYTTSGEITVSISTTPKEVVVEVSDSGKIEIESKAEQEAEEAEEIQPRLTIFFLYAYEVP